jgi:hypothetical protein
MLKRFGTLIWKQTRDISVMNYPNHVVYEIYTHQGYFYVSEDKETKKFSVLKDSKNLEIDSVVDKNKTLFRPNLS